MKHRFHVLALIAALCATALPALAAKRAAPPVSSDPEVQAVLDRVVKRATAELDNDTQFNARYAWTRTKRTDTKDGKGKLDKRTDKTASHDPSTTPPPTQTATYTGLEPAAPADPKSTKVSKKDFLLSPEILGRYKFTLGGRELLDGRPTIILDFVPASRKLPDNEFKDRFINKAAGRVWVDEADGAIAKCNLHLTEEVTVVGGLIGVVRVAKYDFDRGRTADGLWFTRTMNWHVEGRQLLSKKIYDYHEEKKDLRKVW
ncbi:MAG: hypothetical protein HY301_10780 [Verrucomicrobia bacterium]|nr:hypothetical protein [Verrucomicrobiota bacterium]